MDWALALLLAVLGFPIACAVACVIGFILIAITLKILVEI
jgi:hypothetical protein